MQGSAHAVCPPAWEGLPHMQYVGIRVPVAAQQASHLALGQVNVEVHDQVHLRQQGQPVSVR